MSSYLSAIIFLLLFLVVAINESKAGDIPPPETIGACCFEVGEGVCQEISLDECLSGTEGIGWSDELACEPDTCVPDTEGSEDCCSVHTPTACENLSCTETICEIDPYCCIFDWDDICVDEAFELCPDVCLTAPQGPVVIVPAINEWGVLLAALFMGIFAIYRLRQKKLF